MTRKAVWWTGSSRWEESEIAEPQRRGAEVTEATEQSSTRRHGDTGTNGGVHRADLRSAVTARSAARRTLSHSVFFSVRLRVSVAPREDCPVPSVTSVASVSVSPALPA